MPECNFKVTFQHFHPRNILKSSEYEIEMKCQAEDLNYSPVLIYALIIVIYLSQKSKIMPKLNAHINIIIYL